MKHSLMVFVLLGLAACTGPYTEKPAQKADAPVKTGVTISGEARIGVTSGF